MVMNPTDRFGIRFGGQTGAKTPEQKFSLIAGLIYLGIGVVGFTVTGFGDFVGMSHGSLLGIFALNPFHNVVHIAVGAFWLLGALVLSPAGTEGLNIAIGGFYVLAAVLGYLGYLDLVHVGPNADPDNFLHLASGVVTLLFGGGLIRAFSSKSASA